MKEVDLHGVPHNDVDRIIFDACTKFDAPFVVITGDSKKMQEIVEMAAIKMGMRTRGVIGNFGRLIICETR